MQYINASRCHRSGAFRSTRQVLDAIYANKRGRRRQAFTAGLCRRLQIRKLNRILVLVVINHVYRSQRLAHEEFRNSPRAKFRETRCFRQKMRAAYNLNCFKQWTCASQAEKNPRTTHPTVKVKLTKARKEALTAPQVYIRTEEVVGFDWQDNRIVLLQRTNHIT